MRKVKLNRSTSETQIDLDLNIDGNREISIETGVGFFDHMLKAMSFYADFDLKLACRGDLEVDSHHTLEDVGLVLGTALKEALGDRKGIVRFASTITPMDEALALVAIDISNRPYLLDNLSFKSEKIGNMDSQDFKEFFRGFAFSAGITLHIDIMRGENDHHKIEAVFKGLGRALKDGIRIEGNDIVSTKGVL